MRELKTKSQLSREPAVLLQTAKFKRALRIQRSLYAIAGGERGILKIAFVYY